MDVGCDGKGKRALAAALVFLAGGLIAAGCYIYSDQVRGSGQVTREERNVSGFTGVEVSNQGDLKIELGDRESLVIEAEDNLLEYIETEVKGGLLTIETRKNTGLRNTRPIRYHLTVRKLDRLAVSSSGSIEAPALKADEMTVSVSSSGDIDIEALEAEEVSVDISSSGDVRVKTLNAGELSVDISSSGDFKVGTGRVKMQDVTISSSGGYDGSSVESERTEADISSSGSARVWVTEYLDVHISSSGDLFYKGDPAQLQRDVSSSGDVIKIR